MSFVCRLCSSSDLDRSQVTDIFGTDAIERELPSKINVLANILIAQDDPLPNYACFRCTDKLDEVLAFQQQCKQAQAVLWKDFIFSCCARATRLRKDVREHCQQAGVLVHKAASVGVDVSCLRECLWRATEDLCCKIPNICPKMMMQLSSGPTVQLKHCPVPVKGGASDEDEIENALPAFRITRMPGKRTESISSNDSDDQVLQPRVSPVNNINRDDCDEDMDISSDIVSGDKVASIVGEKVANGVGSGETVVNNTGSGDKVVMYKAAGRSGRGKRVEDNKSTIDFDEEMLEESDKRNSDSSKGKCTSRTNVAVNGIQGEIRDGGDESPCAEDVETVKNKIETTEFVDVGFFNNEVVKVNEVKIKEEEEPMLEFTEPVALYQDQSLGGMDRHLEEAMVEPIEKQVCLANKNTNTCQSEVNSKPVEQESIKMHDLQDLVLFCSPKTYESRSAKPKARGSAVAQPETVQRAELLDAVSQTSQHVVYSNAACQTPTRHSRESIYQQTSDLCTDKLQSIQVQVSQGETLHHVYGSNLQPLKTVPATRYSYSIQPSAPPVHSLAGVRQLPVSRVLPLTTNVHNSSVEKLHASRNLGDLTPGIQHILPNQIPTNLLHTSQPVVQPYQGKQQSDNVGVHNVVQYSHPADMSTSVVEIQHCAADVKLVPNIHYTSPSFQHAIPNSRPVISVANHSSRTNVPNIHHPTTSYQQSTSSQPTISVVNHSSLTNMRPAHSTQHPITTSFQHHVSNSQPAISVVNHSSLTNVRAVPSIQHSTTSIQHVTNSEPVISVINHSSLPNSRTDAGIQLPATTSFQNAVSSSQPSISVLNSSSSSDVQTVSNIRVPITSSHVFINLKPIISVKHFSRMSASPISQSKYSESNKQSTVTNTVRHIQASIAKRAADTASSTLYQSADYQSSMGLQPKQPKLMVKPSTANEPQSQSTAMADWNISRTQEPTIQSYSLSLRDWDSLQDDSNTSFPDASLSRQDSATQPAQGVLNSSDTAPGEPREATSDQDGPAEMGSYKEYLQVSGKKFVCTLCEGSVDNRNECVIHIKNHLRDSHFYCRPCRAEVSALIFLKNHLQQCLKGPLVHLLKDLAKVGRRFFKCAVCGVEFVHEISLRYHYKRHAALQYHSKYSYLCPPCGKAFVLRTEYLAHKLQAHGGEESKDKTFRLMCSKCNKFFFSKCALDRHLAKHSDPVVDEDCQIID